MDTSISNKRGVYEFCNKDLPPNPIKKLKNKKPDYGGLFFHTLAGLDEWKKIIIKKLGFGALLDFSLHSDVNDVFAWLVEHLNTDTCTISLDNGFSFTLSPITVQIVLGLPLVGKNVNTKITKEACDIIYNTVHMESPSIECLCSLLNENIDEVAFSRIFMLAALASFIAPNCHGVASRSYYQAIIDFMSSPDHDWCSFTLNCLILHIKSFNIKKSQGVLTEIGGCKILPVIAYFEFLITPDFNLGVSVPRLPQWSTHVVNSYITLDSFHGPVRKFGKLDRKHISSTVFRGTSQTCVLQMPLQIKDYINQKYHGIEYNEQDKHKLEILCRSYFQDIVQNSVPIMKRYIDDMFSLQHPKSSTRVSTDFTDSDHEEKITTVLTGRKATDINLLEWIEPDTLNRELFRLDRMGNDIDHVSTQTIQEILKQEAKSRIINDLNWALDLPPVNASSEDFSSPQILDPVSWQTPPCFSIKQFLKTTLQDEEKQIRIQQYRAMQNQKFSTRSTSFLPIGQTLQGIDVDFNIKSEAEYKKLHGNIFAFPEMRSTAEPHSFVSAQQFKTNRPYQLYIDAEPDGIIDQTHHSSKGSWWGLSLNERLLGKRCVNPVIKNDSRVLPSFELWDAENTSLDSPVEQLANPNQCFSSVSEDINGPLVNQALDQLVMEMVQNEEPHHEEVSLKGKSNPSSSFVNTDKLLSKQTIFANAFEHEFYTKLTKSATEYSRRIFEINKIWIDQKTLTLSMRSGGWIHQHVMDAFGMLILTDMYYRDMEGTSSKHDILKHIVIKDVTKILMDPLLNHTDPMYKGLFSEKHVSIRLEKAGLVHIACNSDKQWILITANFIDSSFDVLNPDPCNEKFETIINTVIYNFKILFLNDYPRCPYFNIHDFQVRYVQVPKHNFRYDSGIFVIQFMLSYNGIEVTPFSNEDIQALREKLLCQLVISRHNEHQVPLVKFFLTKHAPHLLR